MCAHLQEEEDDVMIYERTLAEIDDQLEGWAKVEALHVKKEAKFIKIEIKEEGDDGNALTLDPTLNDVTNVAEDVKVKVEPQEEVKEEMEDSEEEEESDDDFDELLDWRSKGT